MFYQDRNCMEMTVLLGLSLLITLLPRLLPFLMICFFIQRQAFNWEEQRELEFISTEE